MELKNLLSVVIAALTALGAMLFAMGSGNLALAMAAWLAAVASLVVTDFLGAVRLPRNLGSLLMWGIMAVFLPHFILQSNWDHRLQIVASILICLQMTLLFQEKDARAYGWLTVMSLLQAVVASRFNQGIAFGGLLIAYAMLGVFALSLLVLHGQWRHYHGAVEIRGRPAKRARDAAVGHDAFFVGEISLGGGAKNGRWPLAAMPSRFASTPAGTGRSGVVTELFVRLALIGIGAVALAAIIFYTVPRPPRAAWQGTERKPLSTVGFTDQIALGALGEIIESHQEVMQLRLVDPLTQHVYPMRDEIYLRGSVATWYSRNHWRRTPPPNAPESDRQSLPEKSLSERVSTGPSASDPVFQIGSPVLQQIAMEPFVRPDDLFYIWPLVEPVDDDLIYSPSTGRLMRKPTWSGELRGGSFKCKVVTSGLVEGQQVPLVPANEKVSVSPFLQMPGDRSSLPRLTALAQQWLRESRLPPDQHYEVARWFENQLSNSGQFHYTLQGVDRDESIDAIEDFVSNNPRGHCEYFATALALMLRSQGIPSRVVLGYRCDEWHEDQQYYQVRQLHAHAWVEAFLDQNQIPEELRRKKPIRWMHGGWLRLDPTPSDDVGTVAAHRTLWGTWQGCWHSLERNWDKYIVEMDRPRQLESVYEPISRLTQNLGKKLFDPRTWRGLAAKLWTSLATMLGSGIIGWLFGVVMLTAILAVPAMAGWWLVRRLRRLSMARRRRRAGTRSSIEFYRRFEQIAARLGLQRDAGQTPREFARAAGARLAEISGRQELQARAVQVAEAFYRVRFGRNVLDAPAAQTIRQALAELAAGVERRPLAGSTKGSRH